MDFLRNVSMVTGADQFQQEKQVLSSPSFSATGSSYFDDLFPAQNTEVDVSLEWLSIFVEDCLSSTGNYCDIPPPNVQSKNATTTKPLLLQAKPQRIINPPFLQKFAVPIKAKRSKRKRAKNSFFSSWSNSSHHHQKFQLASSAAASDSDPPMLQQAYWLADSELMVEPKKEMVVVSKERNSGVQLQQVQVQPRRCSHCLAQRTPQWRAGPLGPKTLCNACGVRYKSGRLLPEYRPAKSPTFVSYLHSNSHVKVMEMRMATLSSSPSDEQ